MSTRSGRGPRREQVRRVLIAVAAGGLYGSWAGFVHHGLGVGVAFCAGSTQVGLSIFTTLVFVVLLERLFRWPKKAVHGFWLAAFGSSMLGMVWLIVGHALMGTPHIAAAIAPSIIVGSAFDFAYAGRLLALDRRDAGVAGASRTARASRRGGVVSAAAEGRVQYLDSLFALDPGSANRC